MGKKNISRSRTSPTLLCEDVAALLYASNVLLIQNHYKHKVLILIQMLLLKTRYEDIGKVVYLSGFTTV